MKFGRRRRRTETEITVPVFTRPGRSPASVPVLLPLSFHSLPHPLHQSASSAAQLPLRHGSEEQYPPVIPLQLFRFSPSFFIKLLKQQSVADVVPSLPVQLSCLTITCGAQLAAPLPLPVARLSSTVFAFSYLQVRSIHIERSHRKTKTENQVPCFVSFIDE